MYTIYQITPETTDESGWLPDETTSLGRGKPSHTHLKHMDQNYIKEFEKAWYLAYADRATVNPPNWNGWNNEMIERVAQTIPAKYWEQAKDMTSNEAYQVYVASK